MEREVVIVQYQEYRNENLSDQSWLFIFSWFPERRTISRILDWDHQGVQKLMTRFGESDNSDGFDDFEDFDNSRKSITNLTTVSPIDTAIDFYTSPTCYHERGIILGFAMQSISVACRVSYKEVAPLSSSHSNLCNKGLRRTWYSVISAPLKAPLENSVDWEISNGDESAGPCHYYRRWKILFQGWCW